MHNVMFCGESSSGKSSLLHRLIAAKIPEKVETIPRGTIIDTCDVAYNNVAGKKIFLEYLDTTGNIDEDTNQLKYASVAIYIYDITNRFSFARLQDWVDRAREVKGCQFVEMIVGTKLDQAATSRQVGKEEAAAFANSRNIGLFHECSAHDGTNISLTKQRLVYLVLSQLKLQQWNPFLLAIHFGKQFPEQMVVVGDDDNARTTEIVNDHQSDPDGWTPVFLATCLGNVPFLSRLLALKADPNIPSRFEVAPLLISVATAEVPVLQLLVQHKADIHPCQNKYGHSPMYVAAQKGHHHLIPELLTLNANPSVPNYDGIFPIHIAAKQGHSKVIQSLVTLAHVSVDEEDNRFQDTPIFFAAQQGHTETVKTLLQLSANPNHSNKYGETPLFYACSNGHVDIINILLSHNADVNAPDLLQVAAEQNHASAIEVLVANRANIDSQDKNGSTALSLAAEHGHLQAVSTLTSLGATVDLPNHNMQSPLCIASALGHMDVMTQLVSRGSNLSFRDADGRTPLLAAAKNGFAEIVQKLAQLKADLNETDHKGTTALILAAGEDNENVIRELVSLKADISLTDRRGCTAAFVAAEKGNISVLKELLQSGANPNTPTKNGISPVYAAAIHGYDDVVEQLVLHGAALQN